MKQPVHFKGIAKKIILEKAVSHREHRDHRVKTNGYSEKPIHLIGEGSIGG